MRLTLPEVMQKNRHRDSVRDAKVFIKSQLLAAHPGSGGTETRPMLLHQQKLISLMLNCGSPAVQPAKETLAEAGKWTLLPAPRLDEGQALVSTVQAGIVRVGSSRRPGAINAERVASVV